MLTFSFLKVSVGKYLFFHVGNAQYTGIDANSGSTDDIIIMVIALATLIVVLIVLFLSIVIIFFTLKSYTKSKPNKTLRFTNDTNIDMYASPAYGTHQVFTEPGLDHLYERIDEFMDKAMRMIRMILIMIMRMITTIGF